MFYDDVIFDDCCIKVDCECKGEERNMAHFC